MPSDLILASASEIRREMLENAGLSVQIAPARIDEEHIKAALQSELAKPHDIADALAEAKARKISLKHSSSLVLGCDQVLDHGGQVLNKPQTRDEAAGQIQTLSGQTHILRSAAVCYEAGSPIWRHVGVARLTMRKISAQYLESYLDRNWPDIGTSVGGYKIEAEGVRLFSHIQGDQFTIMGLPLLQLLNFLSTRGSIPA